MPYIGQTWVLASIGLVVEMGVLSALKRLLMESSMYDVFGHWILSSKCYLAAFIAITPFLMWPNIILEINRNLL
jgi:hypothetical protein